MILKQTRVKAGGAGKLLSHITNNDDCADVQPQIR